MNADNSSTSDAAAAGTTTSPRVPDAPAPAVTTAAPRVGQDSREVENGPAGARFLLRSIPLWVWAVALLAGVIHMAPYWRAAAQTPDGWTYTANLSASPDYMQYRVWMRQTQVEGIFVSNRFTVEANDRHLPVLLYWAIGRFSASTGVTPEWTYAWLGGLLAVLFTVLLYGLVRHFAPGNRATAWILGALLVGGGLGGYIKLIEFWDWARGFAIVNSLLFTPLSGEGRTALFENFRGNYIIQALFDTHFLLFWLVSTIAVLSLYLTIRQFTYARLGATATLFAFGTFLHVYEGLTLLFIAAGALFMCWRKGLPARTALLTAGTCATAVGVCLIALVIVFRMSGALTPDWRGVHVLPSILLLAYPLAWALIAWGGVRYWLNAGIDGAFLIGWAIGCLALIATGPFFPYPDRGTMTLQIPLFLIAGSIYFASRPRIGPIGAVVIVLLLGSTAVWMTDTWITRTTFKAHETHKWMSQDHVAMATLLGENSTPGDVLLAGEEPLRWLAPEYSGRHFAGHFFLTSRYEHKRQLIRDFYTSMDAEQRAAFLRDQHITWVYAEITRGNGAYDVVPGLRPVDSRPFGTLYRFTPIDVSPVTEGP